LGSNLMVHNLQINPIDQLIQSRFWHQFSQSDYKWVSNWWPDLLDSLTERLTTLHFTHTHTSVNSHIFTSSVVWLRLHRQTFPFLLVTELTPASASSF
jgi:hypothetical protein